MSKRLRYTLAALGAVALSVTSFAIGNAVADVPNDVGSGRSGIPTTALRAGSGPTFSPELLSAESAVAGLLAEAQRVNDWNNAVLVLAERQRNLREIAIPRAYDRTAPAATTATAGSGDCSGPIPAEIIWRESRCDYNAYNPSSGAWGKYQIIPSTWAASCSDLPRTPEGQDECAARLPLSAWAL